MTQRFVPSQPSDLSQLTDLAEMLRGRRVTVLTGAGCSTASGIPDYRGPETSKKKRSPMMYREFVGSEEARRRYWARSAVGWPRIQSARPNRGHQALASLEKRGNLSGLITQNVDRLHSIAGSQNLVELHGALAEVICLDCRTVISRDRIQEQIATENPSWVATCHSLELAPDGDVEIPEIPTNFRVPRCKCTGLLKPHVVFFGENVPKPVVSRAWEFLDQAEALLVVGSSLTVFSGYRFVRGAEKRGIPVGIINLGPTRGDEHAEIRVSARVCDALDALDQLLTEPTDRPTPLNLRRGD